MALTPEDGSIVIGADSYQTLAEARADALNRGLTLSTDDTTAEQQLRQAYYWMTGFYEPQLQGWRISADQTGSMPRSGVYAYGFPVASDEIPQAFKFSQVNAASAVEGGADLNAIKTDADLAGFNVQGVYSETYQSGRSTPVLPQMPAVSQFIRPYTKAAVGGGGLNRTNMGFI